jgi:transcriptional regulator with XRE-family HTH domain
VGGMSLQTLLREYGITRPIELARVLGCDRRYASMLWRGHRKLGARLAMKLWKEKQIPLDKLLSEVADQEPTPKGRPRKQPPGEGST